MNTAARKMRSTSGWQSDIRTVLAQAGQAFGAIEIRNASALEDVRQTGFTWTRQVGIVCLAVNREYFAQALENPCACAIIAPVSAVGDTRIANKAVILSDRAEELYLYLHASQTPNDDQVSPEIDHSAVVDKTAVITGSVRVEAGVRVGPRVVINGPAVVRRDSCIDAGAIVGCDGLYAKTIRGKRVHVPHFGGVEIGECAYLHAGAVVVRPAIRGEVTGIGAGAHIGVMANIGHDAQIGEAATLSSHCVIAGRARIGAHAWIGASATVSNAVRVGEHARVRLGAVVIRNVPSGGDVSGNFAIEHARTLRNYLKGADR